MEAERWRQIEALYHAAVGRNSAERAEFLAHACPDEQVRREVESLLEHRSEGDRLLEDRPPGWESIPAVGDQIGGYRLEAVLGRGGMGVVYRAHDSKLSRPVAIKLLSDELAGVAGRRRFQREARMASALNHPHILTVLDIGEIEGRQYLVTEFVDGGTLKGWASSKKRSWREVVDLLLGVADGLACAHEAGILHRDIKPENILISRNGYAKLADFGLAKLLEPSGNGAETVTATLTHPGAILGTIAYMSPEQASGQPVDARSDLFSFALVLYEMLAGRRAFHGSTSLEILQKIIHEEPEPLPENIPSGLRMMITKALEKRPVDRHQTMRDLAADLRRLVRDADRSESGEAVTSGSQAAPKRNKITLIAATGAIAAVLGVGAIYLWRSKPASPVSGSLTFTQLTNFTDSARAPALSPDGRMAAFIRGGAYFQSRGQIYVKVLPDGEAVQLTHEPELKYGPVFTPDGSRVAYTVLKPGGSWDTWSVPALGGQPTRLLPNASGLTWIDSRRVLFSEIMAGTGAHMGIVSSTEDRSEERTHYFPKQQRAMAHYSYASPDRKWALVVEMDDTTAWQPCRLISLQRSETRQVGPQGACLAAGWSPDGKWMYFNAEVDGAWHLWRQAYPDGAAEQLTFGPNEEEGLAIAPDGRSLVTSIGRRYSTIWLHDAHGDRPISSEAFAFGPHLSADMSRLFYLQRQNPTSLGSQAEAPRPSSPFRLNGTLHSMDLATGKTEPVVPDYAIAGGGLYSISADGKEVIFTTDRNGGAQILIAPLDRHAPPAIVVRDGAAGMFARNDEILFLAREGDKDFLYKIRRDGTARK